MFKLNGKILQQGIPFSDDNGTQYPANWLQLTTLEEKQAIGITEESEPARVDDRFYWNGDLNNPKELEDITDENGLTTKGLKSNFVSQIKQTAGSILTQTDWYVVRKADIGTDIPENVITYRSLIRERANELEQAINTVTLVEQLIALDLSFPKQD
mgnify:CR=1 FL=1